MNGLTVGTPVEPLEEETKTNVLLGNGGHVTQQRRGELALSFDLFVREWEFAQVS